MVGLINIIVGKLILLSPAGDFNIRFFKALNAPALNSLQDSSGHTSVDSFAPAFAIATMS